MKSINSYKALFIKPAIRISLIYTVIGAFWILISDRVVLFFFRNPDVITNISIYKGWAFVLGNGFLLYYLIRKDMYQVQKVQEDLRKKQEELQIMYEENVNLSIELEQRVADRTAQLEAANRELETFSFSVSHDLKAPLRAIDGFSRILDEDYSASLDNDCSRIIKIIRKNTNLMMQLIDDLLSFSRVSMAQISKIEIEMNLLVHNVIADMKLQYPDRKIEFKVNTLKPLYGDVSMFRQVLVNLISNSIKFTANREVAEIEIGCIRQENDTVYYIRDNGVGFDMKYSGKLFGVFQRLHTEDEFDGHGIGLSIIQRIIHKHGGRVWIEAELDKGASVYFSLPGKPE